MKRILILFFAMILSALTCAAQGLVVHDGSGAPTGYCNTAVYFDLLTGQHYACVNHAWQSDSAKLLISGVASPSDINGLDSALAAKAPLASPVFTGTVSGITASMVSLGNVTNTSDANKPVSTAQQTALDLKANLASPTFTGTVAGITKSMVGLGSVDNTSDSAKPVSSAQQTALDLKANLASPTFTGTVSGITKTMVGLSNVDNTADSAKTLTESQITNLTTDLSAKAPLASPTFTGTVTLPTALKLTPVAIGSLPTCNAGATGNIAIVTDALLPAFLASVAAGGSVKVPVFCSGSAWIVY